MADNKTIYQVVLDENGIAVLKQNLADLSNTVCNIEGTLLSGLMNDIGIANEELKQFKFTLATANDDFNKFLAKIEDLKLVSGREESTLDKVDKWFDIIEHATGIINNGVSIFGGIKSLVGKGKSLEGIEEIFENGKEGVEGVENIIKDLSAGARVSGTTDALAAEGTEALSAAGLVEEGAELGALLGPEGMLAGAIIGLVAYGVAQGISSHQEGNVQTEPIPYSSKLDQEIYDLKDAIKDEVNSGQFEYATQDENRLKTLEEQREAEPALMPDNDYVRAYSRKQNAEYQKYLEKKETETGSLYALQGYGAPLSEYQYFQHKKKEQADAKKPYHWDTSATSLAIDYLEPAGTYETAHPYASSFSLGAGGSSIHAMPSSSHGSHASSLGDIRANSIHTNSLYANSFNALPSASHVGVSASVGGGVSGGKGASTHNISHQPSYTINNHSTTSVNNIHDQIVAVLTSAVADAKIGTDIH